MIPWWPTFDGGVEVLLVTTTRGRRWTFPKGNVPLGISPKTAASREAFEEAGLLGRIGDAIGSYSYRKDGLWRDVTLFPMQVTLALPLWPEAFKRERRWMSVEDALDAVRHDGVRECLAMIASVRWQAARA